MWASTRTTISLLAAVLVVSVAVGCTSASTSVAGPSSTKCQISVTNETPELSASGGTGKLSVDASRDCSWSASSQVSWIDLSATSGQGPAAVNYSVLANPAGTPRRGRVVVGE